MMEIIRAPIEDFDPEAYSWASDPAGPRTLTLEESPERGVIRLLVRVPAGFEVPLHTHYADEDVLVLSGSAIFEEGDRAGIFGPGGVLFSAQGTSHVLRAGSAEDCVCYVVMYYDMAASAEPPPA